MIRRALTLLAALALACTAVNPGHVGEPVAEPAVPTRHYCVDCHEPFPPQQLAKVQL